jgi:hypothetical protein
MNSTTHRKETFRETLDCEPCAAPREHLVWLTRDTATRMCTGCGVWRSRERKSARKRRNRAARQAPVAAAQATPDPWAQQEREARRSLAKAARRSNGGGHAFGS